MAKVKTKPNHIRKNKSDKSAHKNKFAKTKTSFKRNNGGKAKSSEQMSKKRFKKEFKSKTKNSQTKNTESIGDKKKSENMEVSDKKTVIAKAKSASLPSIRRERETSSEMKNTIKKAKSMWEKLRRHDMNKDDRTMVLTELMELIRDNLFDLVRRHDTARIIQCLLRFGAEDARAAVLETLKDHVVELSKLKYAKFVVKSLFKYCKPSQREILISMLYNNVVRLVKHTEAAEIVELAYNEYANALQRAMLIQEFYGPQFALFKDQSSSGKSLSEILAENPDRKEKLIAQIKQTVSPLMNKSVVKHSIVHKVLLDFLLNADEKSRSEVIESMREVVVEMLHTREGAKVALNCLWHGTAKDRKIIVKSFKTYVTKICQEEHGHIVLMGIFDSVDDTVLVTKTILSDMISSLYQVCCNSHGRRVLLYLLSPRSSQHFTNQFVELLTPGDGNTHSKKPHDIRWAELRKGISPSLVALASSKAIEWACQKPMAPLLIQVALSASADVTPLYTNIIDGLESSDMVCDPCGHWVLKRLISNTKEQSTSFASLLLDKLSDDTLSTWVKSNRGCFVLSSLLTVNVSRISNIVRRFMNTQKNQKSSQGMEVLMKAINIKQ